MHRRQFIEDICRLSGAMFVPRIEIPYLLFSPYPANAQNATRTYENARKNLQKLKDYFDKAEHSDGKNLLVLGSGSSHGGPFFNKDVSVIINEDLTIDLSLVNGSEFWVGYRTRTPKETHIWIDRGLDGIADAYEFNGNLTDKDIQQSYETGLEFILNHLPPLPK